MRDALEIQYENELNYVRRMALEFARDRPKIADRLNFDRETGESEDPHVERLIEAFAFLTARIRLKLDDDFPEITDALLEILYPHYLAPVPSMSIVQFDLDPAQGQLTTGFTIPRHSRLYSREVGGVPCRFRTCYDVTLWPLELVSARYHTAPFGKIVTPPARSANSPSVLRLEFRCRVPLANLRLDRLRLFLSGDELTVRTLYELIFNNVTDVLFRPSETSNDPAAVVQDSSCLKPVGFGRDEGMLPYSHRSFLGYRLLTEYFTFPSKFLFVDVCGLDRITSDRYRDRLEICFFFDRNQPELETRTKTEMFRLGCCPIVNLFTQEADPIRLSQAKFEYRVIPDVRHAHAMEVYSIDRIQSTNLDTHETIEYQPFYSFRHAREAQEDQVYWHGRRRPSMRKGDAGTDVFLSLADAQFNPRLPAADVLTLETTCSNRDLPGQLRAAGGESWQFQLEGQSPVRRILPVVGPTSPARLPQEQNRWRLISHLALNHLSIVGQGDGADALREILKLYDFANSKVSSQHITGILSVSSRRSVAPIRDGVSYGFCRGMEITIEFDEDKYAGSGVFLFANVLERFLGLYASLNSATRLVARTRQRDGELKRWPFRSGEKTII
ncbi:MAG: type VI secretion system baseplate subunit TssF [Pirellulaceae bacterium]